MHIFNTVEIRNINTVTYNLPDCLNQGASLYKISQGAWVNASIACPDLSHGQGRIRRAAPVDRSILVLLWVADPVASSCWSPPSPCRKQRFPRQPQAK